VVTISFEPSIYILFMSVLFVIGLRVIAYFFHSLTLYVFYLTTLSITKIVYSQ
jgi:hypothetical protein